jgi:hypothetical protein
MRRSALSLAADAWPELQRNQRPVWLLLATAHAHDATRPGGHRRPRCSEKIDALRIEGRSHMVAAVSRGTQDLAWTGRPRLNSAPNCSCGIEGRGSAAERRCRRRAGVRQRFERASGGAQVPG